MSFNPNNVNTIYTYTHTNNTTNTNDNTNNTNTITANTNNMYAIIYVYVCIYTFIYVDIDIHAYIYRDIYISTHIYICIYILFSPMDTKCCTCVIWVCNQQWTPHFGQVQTNKHRNNINISTCGATFASVLDNCKNKHKFGQIYKPMVFNSHNVNHIYI